MKIWNTLETNRGYRAIDLCKFFMAIMVIAIHTNPIVGMENTFFINLVIAIEGFAVPFFFVASGFFLQLKLQESGVEGERYFRKYLLKLIRMYCCWTLISIPLTIYGYCISGENILHCVFSYIKYFLFVGKLYNSYHLWYLLALIYAVIMIWILMKRKMSLNQIALVGFLFFCVNELIIWMRTLDNLPHVLSRGASLYQAIFNKGGIFTGMVYVCIGMVLAEKKVSMKNIYCIVGYILVFCIQKVNNNIHLSNLLSIVEAILFFMFILNIKCKEYKEYVKLRKASTIIYLSHLLFFSFYTIILINNPNKLGLDSFLVTVTLSVLNAVILMKLSKIKGFEWIKMII